MLEVCICMYYVINSQNLVTLLFVSYKVSSPPLLGIRLCICEWGILRKSSLARPHIEGHLNLCLLYMLCYAMLCYV